MQVWLSRPETRPGRMVQLLALYKYDQIVPIFLLLLIQETGLSGTLAG
jgi:hypothetical protein